MSALQNTEGATTRRRWMGISSLEALTPSGIAFQPQVQIPVVYKGRNLELGVRADLMVGGCLLVELKAVERLQPVDQAQVVACLKLLNQALGLLFNFNASPLRHGMQRVISATHARSFPS